MYAIQKNFQFRVKKSNKKLYKITCLDEDCKWHLCAMRVKDCDIFEITKFFDTHICSRNILHLDHRQAATKLLEKTIMKKFERVGQSYTPNDIIDDVQTEYGLRISYNKAWKAKEHALQMERGSPKESFSLLPLYFHMLEKKKPGTITHTHIDPQKPFFVLFYGSWFLYSWV